MRGVWDMRKKLALYAIQRYRHILHPWSYDWGVVNREWPSEQYRCFQRWGWHERAAILERSHQRFARSWQWQCRFALVWNLLQSWAK